MATVTPPLPRRPLPRAKGTQSLGRFWHIVAILFILIGGGTAGYTLLEGWSVLDSTYMTLITLSTVGFKEVHNMSEGGRIFTLVLVVGGIGTFAYAGPKLVSYFIEGEIRDVFQAKRRSKMIKRLQRHHIVCGCGRVGGEVVHELHKTGVPVVAVDQNPEALRDEVEELGVPFVVGNAAESSVLEQTNLQNAASLVTCLPNDADNVYICLAVRALRKDLPIIARANSKEAEEHLRKAGADRVISPYALSGHRMALLCVRPAVTRFLDTISEDFKFEEILVPDNSPIVGKALKDSGIRQVAKAIVVAIQPSSGAMQANPGPEATISSGDMLILLGSAEQLEKVEALVMGA